MDYISSSIEKPKGLITKLAYYTPAIWQCVYSAKVYSARLSSCIRSAFKRGQSDDTLKGFTPFYVETLP
jgi:hypothetical protein